MQHLISNFHEQKDNFTTAIISNRESKVLPTKVTSYCEPHKQSTYYFSSAYLLNFISRIPSEGNAPPLSVCKTDLLLLQYEGFDFVLEYLLL